MDEVPTKKAIISKASKWTKRKTYWLTGKRDFVQVKEVVKRGPNWRITLEDGREFETSKNNYLWYV